MRLRLRQKILLPLLALGSFVVFGLGVWMYHNYQQRLSDELLTEASTLANAINAAAETVSSTGELQRIVNSLAAERDVNLIIVVAGPESRVIASSRQAWRGKTLQELPSALTVSDLMLALKTRESHVHHYVESNELDITQPLVLSLPELQDASLSNGAVVVRLQTTRLSSVHRRDALSFASAVMGGLLGLAVLAWWLLNRHVLSPLRTLETTLSLRAEGDYQIRASLQADDEIGRLAESLNHLFNEIEAEERARASAEINLRRTHLFQQALLNSAGLSFISTDKDGVIQLFNPYAEQLLGFHSDDMVGWSTPAEIHDPEEVAARAEQLSQELGIPVEAGFEAFIAKARLGQPDTNEWTYICKDGSRVPVSLTVTAIHDDAGQLTGYLGIAQDISERKRAEEALRQAKEAAEAASRAKSDFLAVMSHEIRTPMNGVLGMAQLLQQTPLTGQQRQYAQAIRQSGEALLSVINDILDFSKIEAGKLELEPIPFDLEKELHDVLQLLAPAAHEKHLELLFNYPIDCPRQLIGDSTRVRQIALNLVGNALKFTECGHVLVSVTGRSEHGHAKLRFSVRDTGQGIPADKQERLFKPFSQADSSTTRTHGGTGLGLAICKRLVEMMNGQIGVESRLGEGSEFWLEFSLPLDAQPSHPAASQPWRVMIVDDSPINRQILVEMAQHWGLETREADSAAACMQALRQDPHVDILLLDHMMPEEDGASLCKRLRAEPTLSSLPIILLSSSTEAGDLERMSNIGIDYYLSKPMRSSQVLEAIERSLSARGQGLSTPLQSMICLRDAAPHKAYQLNGTVLLAEDTEINRLVATTMLESAGLRVIEAHNGLQACARWQRGDIDLILMDCLMPEMDGLDATRQIRRSEQQRGLSRTPIIALTANALDQARESCLEAGMDDFLAKPFAEQALIDVLQRWLPTQRTNSPDPDETQSSAIPRSNISNTDQEGNLALDEAKLTQMFERFGDRLGRLIELFHTSGPELLSQLELGVVSQDVEAMTRAVHSLKSSAGNLGLIAIQARCAHWEQHFRAGHGEDGSFALAELQPLLSQGISLIDAHFAALRQRSQANPAA